MSHAQESSISRVPSVTTCFTRNQRVTFSRTSVYSWSTSTKPKPRRTAQKSSRTRWRLVVSRTRSVIIDGFHHRCRLMYYPGCSGTPCRSFGAKASGNYRCGTRGNFGVNGCLPVSPVVSFMPCISRFTVYIQHAFSPSEQLSCRKVLADKVLTF